MRAKSPNKTSQTTAVFAFLSVRSQVPGAPELFRSALMLTTSQSGLNIFELMWFVLIVTGAWVGGSLGYSRFGGWGVTLGIPLGGAIGFLAALGSAFLLAVVCKTLFGGTILPPRKLPNKNNDKS